MISGPRRRAAWAADLCRPLPIAAVALLLFNDHVGKHCEVLPSWARGKLSDVAGLFVFPILLFALVNLLARQLSQRFRTLVAGACATATAIAFASVKLWPAANDIAVRWWGVVVPDPTDCFALPVVVLAAYWLARQASAPSAPAPAWARTLVLVVAAIASMASPGIRMRRQFPEWRAVGQPPDLDLGCGTARAWVSKSGKEGVGVTVRIAAEAGCEVEIREARFRVDGEDLVPLWPPSTAELASKPTIHVYMAFPFDGEKAWNHGSRKAVLRLVFAAGARSSAAGSTLRSLDLPLENRLDDFHQHAPSGRCR
jgi:hypothetical protein